MWRNMERRVGLLVLSGYAPASSVFYLPMAGSPGFLSTQVLADMIFPIRFDEVA